MRFKDGDLVRVAASDDLRYRGMKVGELLPDVYRIVDMWKGVGKFTNVSLELVHGNMNTDGRICTLTDQLRHLTKEEFLLCKLES